MSAPLVPPTSGEDRLPLAADHDPLTATPDDVVGIRPWGAYVVLDDGPDAKVKRITVDPGQRLSLQLHHRRAEHWVVVSGTAVVTLGDDDVVVGEGESIDIPTNTAHRVHNPGTGPLVFVEVQLGDYFGEDDIVRLDDDYGRAE
jgi:mannose-6-phosphate isomerase-like protein (cupin superfamily)